MNEELTGLEEVLIDFIFHPVSQPGLQARRELPRRLLNGHLLLAEIKHGEILLRRIPHPGAKIYEEGSHERRLKTLSFGMAGHTPLKR